MLAATHDTALQVLHDHLSHVFGQSFGVPTQLILCSWKNIKMLFCPFNSCAYIHYSVGAIQTAELQLYFWISFILKWGQRVRRWKTIFTWNAFALNGFGYDGSGLVAWLAQSLAKLLYAVSVNNDSMPAMDTHTLKGFRYVSHIFMWKIGNKKYVNMWNTENTGKYSLPSEVIP